MELFEISVSYENENHHFEVRDYMHHEGEQCKFEIYQNGVFVASFEPSAHKHLNLCKNTGVVNGDLLNLLADQIESYNL